jgi:hypothetical protein
MNTYKEKATPESTSIFINASILKQWLSCNENIKRYCSSEKISLLDIVKDSKGNQIKIYLNNS